MTATIAEHNKVAAAAWNRGGADYDGVSAQLADALSHAVQRLWPGPGEDILEVATATGWVARDLARSGATVTAIDIAEREVEAARALSAHVNLPIDFQVADAEALPFGDANFDKVISTFGVMFAGDQQHAATELARFRLWRTASWKKRERPSNGTSLTITTAMVIFRHLCASFVIAGLDPLPLRQSRATR